ncbi:hypothetical protein [Paraburkholderia fungorum]|uniref:Uncharacterized protein n=1 Tax=Paraburkholderia fungorum TaxID=134537 RepID=A0A420FC64_9BURK|nr:hypothetical protein [Paraburkholderia fungorum]RKF30560.1 hypothetical protein BCY88_12925 [Paraburkholderia fungorum]
MKDKVIAVILTVHGLLGAVWTLWIASTHGNPPLFLISNLTLAVAGATAGFGCLKEKRWAAYLGLCFWAIQIVHVLTPHFQFSFTLGFNAVLSAVWYGFGQIGVNVFALVMLVWLTHRISSPDSSFHGSDATVTV